MTLFNTWVYSSRFCKSSKIPIQVCILAYSGKHGLLLKQVEKLCTNQSCIWTTKSMLHVELRPPAVSRRLLRLICLCFNSNEIAIFKQLTPVRPKRVDLTFSNVIHFRSYFIVTQSNWNLPALAVARSRFWQSHTLHSRNNEHVTERTIKQYQIPVSSFNASLNLIQLAHSTWKFRLKYIQSGCRNLQILQMHDSLKGYQNKTQDLQPNHDNLLF